MSLRHAMFSKTSKPKQAFRFILKGKEASSNVADLIVHNSISDLYKALNLPIEQDMGFTVHDLAEVHPEVPYTSPLFRANYFSFVFVKEARGSYTLDEKVYPTEPGTIYFTNPGHIKGFSIEELKTCFIITLTEAFLKENVHPEVFEEFPFMLAETVPPSVLPPEEFAAFETLYLQIYKEYKKDSPYKHRILGNLFVVQLLKIKEKFWDEYNPLEEGDRSSQIVQRFKRSLENHYRALSDGQLEYHNQVQDYAAEQGLHPNYLSNVIKAKTGKSVNGWISEKMISEAQGLMRNTSLTAKQVSQRLGFSEATHFSSYFKKHTGLTPGAFRKQNAG